MSSLMLGTLRTFAILTVLLLPMIGHTATFVSEESQQAQVVGRNSVRSAMKSHRDHLKKTGVGLFYGSQSAYSPIKKMRANGHRLWTDTERFSYLKTSLRQDFVQTLGSTNAIDTYVGSLVGIQEEEPRLGGMEMTSSVLWALKHVMAAYVAAGKTERAEQIARIVHAHGTTAATLMSELQKDGWHSIYWSPDTKFTSERDTKKKAAHLRGATEANNGSYMNEKFKVDYKLVDYRTGPKSKTKKIGQDSLAQLKRVPFWIGMANFGQHMFVGFQTHVTEVLSTELPTSENLIRDGEFETWTGHFKSTKMLSGLIMVPPGSLL